MILDFRGTSYNCKYRAGKHLYRGACFSTGCERGVIKKYAYVTITWSSCQQDERNYCFLNKKELIEYFTEISKLLGFKLISLTESNDSYKLQIKVFPNRRYFIYCAMCVRYAYEFPFSILLYAALRNRNKFPGLDIIQIMQFYIASVYEERYCHCPGHPGLSFYNINSKCQFSLIARDFNYHQSFYKIQTTYSYLTKTIYVLNTKQLPQIVSGINFIVNKCYDKNKKYICRW